MQMQNQSEVLARIIKRKPNCSTYVTIWHGYDNAPLGASTQNETVATSLSLPLNPNEFTYLS